MTQEIRQKHKLVFLGNQFVGKTSIIEQFAYNTFDPKTQTTVGIDFIGKNIILDGKTIRLLIWDTAGQERFHSLIPSYLRDASCAVIVFDVTSRQSFESVEKWYSDVKHTRGSEALIVMLANKLDCDRLVTEKEAREYANKKDMLYFEICAKTGQGIQSAMDAICLSLPTEHSFIITQSQLNQSQLEQTIASNRKPPIQLSQGQIEQQNNQARKCC